MAPKGRLARAQRGGSAARGSPVCSRVRFINFSEWGGEEWVWLLMIRWLPAAFGGDDMPRFSLVALKPPTLSSARCNGKINTRRKKNTQKKWVSFFDGTDNTRQDNLSKLNFIWHSQKFWTSPSMKQNFFFLLSANKQTKRKIHAFNRWMEQFVFRASVRIAVRFSNAVTFES